MDDNDDLNLLLKLQLEQLSCFETNQKQGMKVPGHLTDLQLAFSLVKEDMAAHMTSTDDRTLALSSMDAAFRDQDILEFIRKEELIAERDHNYALTLDGDADNLPEAPEVRDPHLEASQNSVTMIMSSLFEHCSLDNDFTAGESSKQADSLPDRMKSKCVSCFEDFATLAFTAPCQHAFCHDCTRRLILETIKEESLYPPRCCNYVLPPQLIMSLLDWKELEEFSNKAIEYESKIRVYCADPTCSEFIRAASIKDEHGTCTKCHQMTHIPCRSLAHPNTDCPNDVGIQQLLETAETEGWKRCENCRRMVELTTGCNHMTCHCGREFCYICGLKWRTCQCPLWHEERLVERANRAVENEVPADADNAQRQAAFDHVYNALANHEVVGCQHNRRWQWGYRDHGDLQCEVCEDVLPQYIFVCTNCQMRACYRCRRHRLR